MCGWGGGQVPVSTWTHVHQGGCQGNQDDGYNGVGAGGVVSSWSGDRLVTLRREPASSERRTPASDAPPSANARTTQPAKLQASGSGRHEEPSVATFTMFEKDGLLVHRDKHRRTGVPLISPLVRLCSVNAISETSATTNLHRWAINATHDTRCIRLAILDVSAL